jgi:hypothetical protein
MATTVAKTLIFPANTIKCREFAIFSVKWQQVALNLHPHQCSGIFYKAVLTSKPLARSPIRFFKESFLIWTPYL